MRRSIRLCVWKGAQIIVDRAQLVSTQRRAKVWPRHYLQEAALLRIIAAVPECRSAVLQLLADRAGAFPNRKGGFHDSAWDAMTSGGSVTPRLRTVSQ